MRAGPVQAPSAMADHHDAERWADDADEGQRQQEARHGLEGVGDAHQHLVDDAAGKAGERADDRADDDRRRGGGKPDGERGAGAVNDAGQHVAAEPVGAERQRPVLERRAAAAGPAIDSGSRGKEQRRQQRHGGQRQQDERAGRQPSGVRKKRADASCRLARADARVEQGVEQVDDEIDRGSPARR